MDTAKPTQGHPKGLYSLFFTEMWERFSYYGMRALLTIFLTAELATGGFGLDRSESLSIYGVFTALVYLTPILGGWFADKILGQRKSILIGGLVMAIGQFMLAASAFVDLMGDLETRKNFFYLGLGVLILGNGFFKPNISTIVGDLYDNDDPRKDGAFTIFYMGINIGAFLSPFVAGTLGEKVGWPYGYLAAGIGMLIGVLWFYGKRNTLEDIGLPPGYKEKGITKLLPKDWRDVVVYTIANVAFVFLVMFIWNNTSDLFHTIMVWVLGIAGAGFIGLSIFKGTTGSTEWTRVFVILILAFFNIVFWAGFEQAGGTFNLFAQENTDRNVSGFEIPTTWFQNINPIAIVTLAPLFSILWIKLAAKRLNPRTPVKFAMAMFIGAVAFFIMTQAQDSADAGNLVSPMWLVVVYVLLTIGELMLSPIGLSMVTKLSPGKITSIMMGVWMASFALGNYLAATLEQILTTYDFDLYPFITYLMLGSGVSLLLLSPLLNKFMKGIH
ncbi:MFS transporter [Chryseobacterium lacus]|uniref:MFS transporter n=1 Tax=Chryseobacterium lacus TaxID=2058346 RepID=A0A368MZX8_9FLAO|nr:peptide MFS transporter [Chryseobacterium lacus]RCU42954.1 MFS transporter [Chryseobacterium lacus]RST27806.1 MFS transporter [Chryseobacterium lacus]